MAVSASIIGALAAAVAGTTGALVKRKKDKEAEKAGAEQKDAARALAAAQRLKAAEAASAQAKGKTLGSTGGLGRVSLLGG